jgi:acetyltransferase-like isoleucine patch superfamily enzyme
MGIAPVERAATEIGSGVYIGPNAIIQMGTKIGDRAIIGACAFVNRDGPPDAKVFGVPGS